MPQSFFCILRKIAAGFGDCLGRPGDDAVKDPDTAKALIQNPAGNKLIMYVSVFPETEDKGAFKTS